VFTAFAADGQTGLFAMRETEPGAPPYLAGGHRIDDTTLRAAIVLARRATELCRS